VKAARVEKLILGKGRDCPLHSIIVMRKWKRLFMNSLEWKDQIFKLVHQCNRRLCWKIL